MLFFVLWQTPFPTFILSPYQQSVSLLCFSYDKAFSLPTPVHWCPGTLKTIMGVSESLLHVSIWSKQDITLWQCTSERAGNQTKPQTVMHQSRLTNTHTCTPMHKHLPSIPCLKQARKKEQNRRARIASSSTAFEVSSLTPPHPSYHYPPSPALKHLLQCLLPITW